MKTNPIVDQEQIQVPTDSKIESSLCNGRKYQIALGVLSVLTVTVTTVAAGFLLFPNQIGLEYSKIILSVCIGGALLSATALSFLLCCFKEPVEDKLTPLGKKISLEIKNLRLSQIPQVDFEGEESENENENYQTGMKIMRKFADEVSQVKPDLSILLDSLALPSSKKDLSSKNRKSKDMRDLMRLVGGDKDFCVEHIEKNMKFNKEIRLEMKKNPVVNELAIDISKIRKKQLQKCLNELNSIDLNNKQHFDSNVNLIKNAFNFLKNTDYTAKWGDV